MITVATCSDFVAASNLKLALEAAGIPALLPDVATATAAPHLLAGSGVRVQVAAEHAERAMAIVEATGHSPLAKPSGTSTAHVTTALVYAAVGIVLCAAGFIAAAASAAPGAALLGFLLMLAAFWRAARVMRRKD